LRFFGAAFLAAAFLRAATYFSYRTEPDPSTSSFKEKSYRYSQISQTFCDFFRSACRKIIFYFSYGY
jgi:hypothetical protein